MLTLRAISFPIWNPKKGSIFHLKIGVSFCCFSVVACYPGRPPQSPQIRFHFRLYFSKKDQIARRREWFSGVSARAFLWFASGPSKSLDPCSQCCVGMQTLEFSQKLVLQFQHWLQGYGEILLAIVAAHFFKGNCFLKAGLEVSATRFSRIKSGQVG